jgi:CRISPR system Cascade subunit CasD
MMVRHLILTLEAPLMAFGGETIDNLGVIRSFPAVSMLTGLLANALGWRRVERQRHQDLQDRLVFAARIDQEPHGGLSMQDFQTAQLGASDRGWTTRGAPEERAGGANTYNAPHLRYRDYHADMRVTVALRLEPSDDAPALDVLAVALEEPARPLFIGRKPCLPSRPLFDGFGEGETALDALLAWPLNPEETRQPATVRLLWPEGEDAPDMNHVRTNRRSLLTDERNWVSGLHGGGRPVCEGTAPPERFGTTGPDEEGQS